MTDKVSKLTRFGYFLIVTATFVANDPQQKTEYSGKVYFRRNEESELSWVADVEASSKEELISKAEEKCQKTTRSTSLSL